MIIMFFFFAFIAVEGTFTYIISRDLTISLLDLHRIYCWWELYLISYVLFCFVLFFSGSHVRMWELDHKKGWALKNWCFRTVVLEKTLESPLDCKEIKPVNPKGNQSWIFIGRTGVEAETPILWPPDIKSQLMVKDPDARKDWGQKGATEDEMVGLTNASLFRRIILVTCCSYGGFWVTFCLPWEEDCIAHSKDNTGAETQSLKKSIQQTWLSHDMLEKNMYNKTKAGELCGVCLQIEKRREKVSFNILLSLQLHIKSILPVYLASSFGSEKCSNRTLKILFMNVNFPDKKLLMQIFLFLITLLLIINAYCFLKRIFSYSSLT